MDPSLAGALGDEAERQGSAVPDLTARSFDAEDDADDFDDDEQTDFTARVDEGSSEVQQLFSQGETMPGADEDMSAGAASTHSVGSLACQ
jgi:anion-transporting  ArsA/GET3 family ATPase